MMMMIHPWNDATAEEILQDLRDFSKMMKERPYSMTHVEIDISPVYGKLLDDFGDSKFIECNKPNCVKQAGHDTEIYNPTKHEDLLGNEW